MPLQATSGAASYDAFGGGVPIVPQYIEDAFSCFLYTGDGGYRAIVNGIDLAGNGGLVWTKSRTNGTRSNVLIDTNRGQDAQGYFRLFSNSTLGAVGSNDGLKQFLNNGYVIGPSVDFNQSGDNFVSWTFREQPKFFDVVTWTGDDTSNRQIAHNLGSAPGCIILKSSSNASSWFVYHRSTGDDNVLFLNSTGAVTSSPGSWATSSTTFTLGNANFNISGRTYVAYLFAHDAGGFGLTGTDNVISCGSWTQTGSGAVVTLGYEPQWILFKSSSGDNNWRIVDNMRGMTASNTDQVLVPNSSAAETDEAGIIPTATGFNVGTYFGTSGDYIYIAIRRGPMKVPTTGTSVFAPATYTGNGANQTFTNTVNNGGSLVVIKGRNSTFPNVWYDQLRGAGNALASNSTSSALQAGATFEVSAFTNKGFSLGENFNYDVNNTGAPFVYWQFVRAPGFFDEVCYTGTGSASTVAHNLTVVPELIIVKTRSGTSNWMVYSQPVGNTAALYLNANFDPGTNTWWNNTTPTSSVFSLGTTAATNASGATFVAYLFASAPGVSKVGSYTGNGTTQTINCGFTSGARFVLIKRTDAAGDWYVWDSARGIVAGNDPYLLLNSTAAEVTNTDFVDTAATGFEISSTAPAAINASGGTFIFLAIS